MRLTQAAAGSSDIDYRLLRATVLQAWRDGKVGVAELCDAQLELRRNAEFCGRSIDSPCPVCEALELVEVTYVFGPRLPSHGRCVTTKKEMIRLKARKQTSQAYAVEVCKRCGWNHLLKSYLLGGTRLDSADKVGT